MLFISIPCSYTYIFVDIDVVSVAVVIMLFFPFYSHLFLRSSIHSFAIFFSLSLVFSFDKTNEHSFTYSFLVFGFCCVVFTRLMCVHADDADADSSALFVLFYSIFLRAVRE